MATAMKGELLEEDAAGAAASDVEARVEGDAPHGHSAAAAAGGGTELEALRAAPAAAPAAPMPAAAAGHRPLAALHAPSSRVTSRTFWRCAALGCAAACVIFVVAVAGLAVAARAVRPEVWLSANPSSPAGYTYGGAAYQGSGSWVTNKAVLPSPRSDLCAVALSDVNAVYLLGGIDDAGAVLADAVLFDPIFERYNTSLPAMPSPLYRHACAGAYPYVWVAGGVATRDGAPTAAAAVYDVRAAGWVALPAMSVARSDAAAAAVGGRLYVFGGYGDGFDMTVTGSLAEVYDAAAGAWRAVAPMPTPRGDLQAVAFGDRIFVVGGWQYSAADPLGSFVAVVEAYSPASNSWARHANMLVPKGDFALAVYRGQLFAVGGEVWSGRVAPCDWDPAATCDVNQVPTHDLLSLLPDTPPASAAVYGGVNSPGGVAPLNLAPGVWVPRAPMPGARFRFAAAANDVAQAIFVFGGAMERVRVVDTVSAFYDTDHPHLFVHYIA